MKPAASNSIKDKTTKITSEKTIRNHTSHRTSRRDVFLFITQLIHTFFHNTDIIQHHCGKSKCSLKGYAWDWSTKMKKMDQYISTTSFEVRNTRNSSKYLFFDTTRSWLLTGEIFSSLCSSPNKNKKVGFSASQLQMQQNRNFYAGYQLEKSLPYVEVPFARLLVGGYHRFQSFLQ